jgi:hypothetical protein
MEILSEYCGIPYKMVVKKGVYTIKPTKE